MALERLTKSRDEWNKKRLKYLDYLNDSEKKPTLKKTCTDINEAMNEYYIVTGNRFALPRNLEEPKLTDFYVLFIILGMGAVGYMSYKLLKDDRRK